MYKFKRMFFIGLAMALITACAPKPIPVINLTSAFDIDHARSLLKEGANTVKGSALMRQINGSVVTCAGQTVNLIPATLHAQERMRIFFGNRNKGANSMHRRANLKGTPPEYFTTVRQTSCDALGYFSFAKVANGTFYITTNVIWGATARNMFGDFYTAGQGGALMYKVNLRDGETKEIVLSP